MREPSIFVDESGDFGNYEAHSPFYLFTLVFHTGPIIRREAEYKNFTLQERRALLNKILVFTKKIDISYVTFSIDKKKISSSFDLSITSTKLLASFIKEKYKQLSKTEIFFFGSNRDFKKNYMKQICNKKHL